MSGKRMLQVGHLKSWWLLLREWIVVMALSLISTSALAAPFYVPSGSMEPTLAIGDGILATKFDYGYSRFSLPFALGPASERRLLETLPSRGDVVVFH